MGYYGNRSSRPDRADRVSLMSLPTRIFQLPRCRGWWTKWYCQRRRTSRTMKLAATRELAEQRLPVLQDKIRAIEAPGAHRAGIPEDFDVETL